MPTHWNADHRLNVFVLGPMPSAKSLDSSCRTLKQALDSILAEPDVQSLLREQGTQSFQVDIPEEQDGAIIKDAIFLKLDLADLVVINITPKDKSSAAFSPNVFYELGLVHALGIPYLLVSEENTPVPFYLGGNRIHFVQDFTEATLTRVLRPALLKFLGDDPGTDFTSNPISDFYTMPVVDISAAIGIATSYFENLIRRSLLENGFIGRNGGEFRHLIVCRPSNILAKNYEEDFEDLSRKIFQETGLPLVEKRFPKIEGFDKRGLVGNFVGDLMIDLPSIAYTLKNSPRFRSLQDRMLKPGRGGRKNDFERVMHQASEKLLDQMESGLHYHVQREQGFRKSALSFSNFRDISGDIKRLLKG